MNPRELQELKEEIVANAEAYGREVTPAAIRLMASDLSGFELRAVTKAMQDCRRSISRFPTIADIISKIEGADGRPGGEEAWALIPKDGMTSAVWTIEMATAYGAAHPLIRDGDEIAARMAFKEVYEKLVKEARSVGIPATWSATLGEDKSGREVAITEASKRNKLTLDAIQKVSDLSAPPIGKIELASIPPDEAKKRIRLLIESISKPVNHD